MNHYRITALWIIAFLVMTTIPYSLLISEFGYDDILRAPPLEILQKFHDGGDRLIWIWFAFAISALTFIPVAAGIGKAASKPDSSISVLNILSISSALVQAIGLLRWVFVVPLLAETTTNPASSEATKTSAIQLFQAFHQFGGVLLGEFIGQLLLAIWTLLIVIRLYQTQAVPRIMAYMGAITLPLWMIGMTEHLHTVIPSVTIIPTTPAAFMLWQVWLLFCAVALFIKR
jgi:hypothetical protein